MEQLNYGLLFIATAFVVATVFLLANPQAQTINISTNPEKNKLEVQGLYEQDVAPDKAVVTIGIVTNATLARDAQDANRKYANEVILALKAVGVDTKDIATSEYNMHKLSSYNQKINQYVEYGYEVRNELRVTTTELDKIGTIIDSATQAGANEINQVVFMLSDQKEAAVRTESLSKAAAQAKEKATVITNTVGIRLKSPIYIRESFSYAPLYKYDYAGMAPMEARAPTPILEKQVHLSSSILVTYETE